MFTMKTYLAVATVAAVCNSATAILGTIAGEAVGSSLALSFTGLGASAATTAFITPAGAALAIGGGLLLKAAALGALGADLALRRKRFAVEDVRSEEETDLMIASIMANEPQQCYRRLVCDLATGELPQNSGDVILSLFKKPVGVTSARFDLATAAQIGKDLKSSQTCEYRFSCPLSGAQLAKIFH